MTFQTLQTLHLVIFVETELEENDDGRNMKESKTDQDDL